VPTEYRPGVVPFEVYQLTRYRCEEVSLSIYYISHQITLIFRWNASLKSKRE
jgi:hypothetical protein